MVKGAEDATPLLFISQQSLKQRSMKIMLGCRVLDSPRRARAQEPLKSSVTR
jgi:hypothetical protein